MIGLHQLQTVGIRFVETPSLTDAFHRVNRLLPEDQEILSVSPDTTVAEAIACMQEFNYSQLPVIQGNQVLGAVSFRSLARGMVELGTERVDLAALPVRDFVEKLDFVHIYEEFIKVLKSLDRQDAVLVGRPDRLQGIVTPMDVLRYLYRVASPFVLLAEIELSLRRLIQVCVDGAELQQCIRITLTSKYGKEDLPSGLREMTFSDYMQLVGHGDTWPKFRKVFGGKGDWHRKHTRSKLEEVRDLRNDVFHFRRDLDSNDYETLMMHRGWLLNLAVEFEAKTKAGK